MEIGVTDDQQLLELFLSSHSQAAFAELVRRHINLVFNTAVRRLGGDRHLAQDVTQDVFVALAKKAADAKTRPVLAGWLYKSTRFAAAQAVRTERRRRNREQEAHNMDALSESFPHNWERLGPVLDEALEDLSERDRELMLLRFFENRALADVGARFALSPDAARMRIDRALEKLRRILAKRGIASTAAAVATILIAQSSQAAPVGLSGQVVSGVFSRVTAAMTAGTAVKTAAIISAWKVAAVIAVAALGTGMVAYRSYLNARAKMTSSRLKMPPMSATAGTDAKAIAPSAPEDSPSGLEPPQAVRSGQYQPADRALAQLENSVTLTADQEKQALQIFQDLKDVMDSMTMEDRLTQGTQSRQDAKAAIRAILTPQQQAIYDQTPQRLRGGAGSDPAMQALNRQIRTFVTTAIRASSDVAAQVGTIQKVVPVSGGTRAWAHRTEPGEEYEGRSLHPNSGSDSVQVTGSSGVKIFTIFWKMDAAGVLTVDRIALKTT